MKLLYLTDTHIRGNSPRNRKDNFPESLKKKLSEIVSIVQDYKVDYVLHGGDFFDMPNPSLTVAAEFISIFREINVPLYGVAGNHDIYAYNPATLERTMLGFLARLGFVKLLTPGEPVYLKDKDNSGFIVQLTGQHFHYDIDRRDPLLDYTVKKLNCDVAVHLVHGMLLDREIYPGARCTLIEHVARHTEADYTLCGHAHLGYADVKIDGKYFINPGAVARLTALPGEMERDVQVVLLDFNNRSLKKIKLKDVLPGSEALDRRQIELDAFQEEKLSQFVQKIKDTGDYEASGLDEIIEAIAGKEKIPPEVKTEALNRLGAAQEAFGSRGLEKSAAQKINH